METVKHGHPACEAGPHRHEKVEIGGSAGGEITEGCKEHYDERIVAEEIVDDIKNNKAADWRRYFVMSEILSAPRCKRR